MKHVQFHLEIMFKQPKFNTIAIQRFFFCHIRAHTT